MYMPHNTYRSLPLESLYELFCTSVRDMLAALRKGKLSHLVIKLSSLFLQAQLINLPYAKALNI